MGKWSFKGCLLSLNGYQKSINKSTKNTFIYSEDATEQLNKISYGVPRHIRKFWELLFHIYLNEKSMGIFTKLPKKSAVSINSQTKTFIEDQLYRVLYLMKNSVWVPGH